MTVHHAPKLEHETSMQHRRHKVTKRSKKLRRRAGRQTSTYALLKHREDRASLQRQNDKIIEFEFQHLARVPFKLIDKQQLLCAGVHRNAVSASNFDARTSLPHDDCIEYHGYHRIDAPSTQRTAPCFKWTKSFKCLPIRGSTLISKLMWHWAAQVGRRTWKGCFSPGLSHEEN